MESWRVIVLIIGMAVVTYLPRALPLIMLSGRSLSRRWHLWLRFMPCAAMAALLSASLEAQAGSLSLLGFDVRSILASIPAAAVAVKYRSVAATVVAGIVGITVIRFVWA
ncbi:MAG: AzlD domain-containing protein [Firmicutes bacterium]|mgnify:CR=1 FL=1|jgi:branched-subunit amino acid transport protein|nr:AzlD domain-containing protein [Bacillota bacterium]